MDQARGSTGSASGGTFGSATGSGSSAGGDAFEAAATGGSGSAGSLGEQGQEAVGQIQEQASRLVDLAREQLNVRLGVQKETAAGGLGTIAMALREAGRQVREQGDGQDQVARYVDAAAGQVEQLADTLRTQDIGELVTTVGRYAQRQPAAFLAAAFALGFAGTRFFRSSAPPRRDLAITPYRGGYGDWTDRYAMGDYRAGYESGSMSGYGYGAGGAGGYGAGAGAAYGTAGTAGVGYEATTPTAGMGLAGEVLAGSDLVGSGVGGTGAVDLGPDLAGTGIDVVDDEVLDVELGGATGTGTGTNAGGSSATGGSAGVGAGGR